MLSNFQNGVTSFGIPQIGGGVALSVPRFDTGEVFFVDPSFNPIANLGGQRIYNTISQAVSAAHAGDTIFIFPGSYEENLVITKDYITLIGAQYAGYARPDIEAASGVTLTVTGQGFRAIHCRFVGTEADPVVQTGNGFEYLDNVFDGDDTAEMCGLRLKPSDTDDSLTASEGNISGNLFRGNAIGIGFDTGAAPAVGVGSTDNLIQNNIFDRNDVDLVALDTSEGGVYSLQFTKIIGNTFMDKGKATYIDLTTTPGGSAGDQSGVVNNNYFASDTMSTTVIKAVGTAFTFSGNFITTGIVDGSSLD